MKYKVGDKVKIKSIKWYYYNKNFDDKVQLSYEYFVSEMSKHCGDILTIESISEPFYYLKEDSDKYRWTDEMFEDDLIQEETKTNHKKHMTQEQKDLLLKDLCGRLPYKVKISVNNKVEILEGLGILDNVAEYGSFLSCDIDEVKPYLFPLSSMTDELWDKEFRGYGITEDTRYSFKYGYDTLEFNKCSPDLLNVVRFINQLVKNHFDIYGLIEKGLAIDATNLNIY